MKSSERGGRWREDGEKRERVYWERYVRARESGSGGERYGAITSGSCKEKWYDVSYHASGGGGRGGGFASCKDECQQVSLKQSKFQHTCLLFCKTRQDHKAQAPSRGQWLA